MNKIHSTEQRISKHKIDPTPNHILRMIFNCVNSPNPSVTEHYSGGKNVCKKDKSDSEGKISGKRILGDKNKIEREIHKR